MTLQSPTLQSPAHRRQAHRRPRIPARKKKLLFVTRDVDGGIGRHLVDLAEGMVARGWDVHCVRSDKTEGHVTDHSARLDAMPGVTVHPIPMRRAVGLHDLRSYLAFRRVVKRHGPFDIAHGHGAKGGVLARLPCPDIHARVYTPHAFITLDRSGPTLRTFTYRTIESLLGRRWSDALVLVSDAETEEAERLRIDRSICHTIPNGIHPPEFLPKDGARQRLGASKDSCLALFVGRFTEHKAPERFLELISTLAPDYPSLIGVMIGNGRLRKKIERDAQNGHISERVIFHDSSEATLYMKAADLLIVTSRYEGFPYILIEGLFAGLPIISYNIGGAREAIRTGKNGFISAEGDKLSLELSARKLIENPTLRSIMSKHSLKLSKNFNTSTMIESIENIYRSCLAPST